MMRIICTILDINNQKSIKFDSNNSIVNTKRYNTSFINIHYGDCLSLFNNIYDNSIDFILTDPPYFLDQLDNNWNNESILNNTKKSKTIGGLPAGMKFDKMQGKRLQDFFYKAAIESYRVLKPGGYMIAFSQGRLVHRLAISIEDARFEIRDMLIWKHKGGQGKAFTQNHFVQKMNISELKKEEIISTLDNRKTPQIRPMFEPMVLAQKPKEGTFIDNWLKYRTGLIKIDFDDERYQQTTIFKYNKPHKNKEFEHMTIKPIGLFKKLIEIFTIENQLVLDPFLGSGTCAEASLLTNRRFIGFEIEKKYYEISLERIRRYEET